MNFLSRFFGGAPTVPPAPTRSARAPVADEEAVRGGCGWFDSSHELQCGLWVREHASADELAADMPLAAWLDWQLAGWRPRAQA